MPQLTYSGFAPRGHVHLPGRVVPFTRGVPVEFTADEAAVLPADEWQPTKKSTPKPKADEATTKEP